MHVKLKLFASLRNGRFKEKTLDIKEGSTLIELLQQLGIEKEAVAILLVNGRDGEFRQELKEGDVVSVFPPLGGG
ncbi:MAG: MoaD/ThiS family protein [Bacillota bacterium]